MARGSEPVLLRGRTRAAVVSLLAMMGSGVVLAVGSIASAPSTLLLVAAVILLGSVTAWAVLVFRDATASDVGVGGAMRRSLRLTVKAVFELVP